MSELITVARAGRLLDEIKKQLPNQFAPDALRCNRHSYEQIFEHYQVKAADPQLIGTPFSGFSIFIKNEMETGIYEVGFNVKGQFKTPIEAWAGKFGSLPVRPIKLEGRSK